MKRGAFSLIVALTVTLVPGSVFALQAPSQGANNQGEGQVQGLNPREQKAPENPMMSGMMARRRQMMAKMQQMNAVHDHKLAAMNAAKTDKDRIAAMEAVINEMASQRKEMMNRTMGVQGNICKMMGGGMEKMGPEAMGEGVTVMRRMKGGKNMVVIIHE